MKLISWNVNGREVTRQAQALLGEGADLIALQEVRHATGDAWTRALAEGGFDESVIRTTCAPGR
jgi:exonuclease III